MLSATVTEVRRLSPYTAMTRPVTRPAAISQLRSARHDMAHGFQQDALQKVGPRAVAAR